MKFILILFIVLSCTPSVKEGIVDAIDTEHSVYYIATCVSTQRSWSSRDSPVLYIFTQDGKIMETDNNPKIDFPFVGSLPVIDNKYNCGLDSFMGHTLKDKFICRVLIKGHVYYTRDKSHYAAFAESFRDKVPIKFEAHNNIIRPL